MNLGHNITTYNLLIAVCIALMAGVAIYDNFAPRASVKAAERKAEEQKAQLNLELKRLREDFDVSQKDLDSRIWEGTQESASPIVLAKLNDFAVSRGIGVKSFRPQKPSENGGLVQLGYVLALEGTFPQILDMVRDIEQKLPRVAVHQINFVSADAAAGTVSANLGLAAFVSPPPPEKKGSTTPSRRLASRGTE
jgi:Tfp pilus assembly protein PilO